MEEKSTHLDDILIEFNVFGWYYTKVLLLVFIANMSNNAYSENYVLVADQVGYKCKDKLFENNTCSYGVNKTDFCREWEYDDPNTFVAEFQLACQDWKRSLVGTVHNFGNMIGLVLIGSLSDRWGRKKLVVFTGVAGAVFGVARSFTTWYWLYISLEFLEAAVGDISSTVFMLNIETLPKEKRALVQISTVGYSLGTMLLALSAYLFPYWRTLLRVIYTPGLLFLAYIFLLDESPRWLLSKGRKDEAVIILEKIAKKSDIVLGKNAIDSLSHEEDVEIKFIELLKETITSGALMKRLLICLVWWITSTFVHFGLSINSVFLNGNKYVNFALVGVAAIPANFLTLYSLMKLKRKHALTLFFIITAALFLIQPFIPTNLPWLSVLLFMCGKLVSSSYFDITYIYTSELFPTYTRNSMHALCSSLGRIGSIVAPQTPLLIKYWHGLPSLVFAGTSFIAGLVTLLAPDTAHCSLPDNVREAEAIGTKNKKKFDEQQHIITSL